MIISHVQKGEWPPASEIPELPEIRIAAVRISTELDTMYIDLYYGCSHTKFNNLAEFGKWWCKHIKCPQFLGNRKAR
jgi:hypothetical protein